VEALRARDPDRAEAAMRRHIEEPGRWVYEALSREDPEPQQSS